MAHFVRISYAGNIDMHTFQRTYQTFINSNSFALSRIKIPIRNHRAFINKTMFMVGDKRLKSQKQ